MDGERTDEALRQDARDAALRALIRGTTDAVVFIDEHARIRRLNPSCAQMFGYEEGELLGRDVTMLMPERYACEHADYIDRYERTGERRAIGRIRMVDGRRKDGSTFPLELSVTEVVGDDTKYAAFMRDVSKQQALQQRVVDSERLAAVGMTASLFAHEVANPLNGMQMHVQLLQRHAQRNQADDKTMRHLSVLTEEIRRLEGLLREFRAFQTASVGALVPLDIESVLDRALRFSLPEDGIEVRRDLTQPLPFVLGDPNKLQQVLINLIKNAVEAMPEGGALSVAIHPADGDLIVIEISDTGCGIPEGVDVFEPFRTTKTNGSGLGLPLVNQIVAAHGGTVTYRSAPERGTTFVLSLRAAD